MWSVSSVEMLLSCTRRRAEPDLNFWEALVSRRRMFACELWRHVALGRLAWPKYNSLEILGCINLGRLLKKYREKVCLGLSFLYCRVVQISACAWTWVQATAEMWGSSLPTPTPGLPGLLWQGSATMTWLLGRGMVRLQCSVDAGRELWQIALGPGLHSTLGTGATWVSGGSSAPLFSVLPCAASGKAGAQPRVLKGSCGKQEAWSPVGEIYSKQYAHNLYQIPVAGKTEETSVWVFLNPGMPSGRRQSLGHAYAQGHTEKRSDTKSSSSQECPSCQLSGPQTETSGYHFLEKKKRIKLLLLFWWWWWLFLLLLLLLLLLFIKPLNYKPDLPIALAKRCLP